MLKKAKIKKRAIDTATSQAWGDLHGRFQIVSKNRANVWLTAGVLLFIFGFIAAFVLVVSSPSNEELESRATHAAETSNSSQLPQLTKDLVNVSSGGSVIAKFFRPQNKTADANSAAVIAQQRAKLMSVTVDKDADLTLQSTLSAKDRSKIPASVQKYVEQPITNVTGVVSRVIGETFKAGPEDPSLDTYMITTKGGQTQELKFGGLKQQALERGVVASGAQVKIASGLQLPGGEIVTPFQNLTITQNSQAQPLTGSLTASVIAFKFSDQADQSINVNDYKGVLDQVAAWYNQYSGKTLTIQYKYATATPTVSGSSNVSQCNYFNANNPGIEALGQAGMTPSALNIYIVPRNTAACGDVLAWGSLNVNQATHVKELYILGTDPALANDPGAQQYIITHEMGHTFGLEHTQGAECCDPMRAFYQNGLALQTFGSGYQSYMGWLSGGGEVTASATKKTYTLNSIESASGLRNINIGGDCDGGSYNLEKRASKNAFILRCTANDVSGVNVNAVTEYITSISSGSSYDIPGTTIRITAKSDSDVEIDGASGTGSGPGGGNQGGGDQGGGNPGGGGVPSGSHSGNSDCAGTDKKGGCFALTCPNAITASHGIITVPIGATGDYQDGIVAGMRSFPHPGIRSEHDLDPGAGPIRLRVGMVIPFPVDIGAISGTTVPAGNYDMAIDGEGISSPLDGSFHGHYPYSVCTTKLTVLDTSTGGGASGDLSMTCPGTQYIVLPSESAQVSVASTSFGVSVSSSKPTNALATYTAGVSPDLVGDGTYPVRLSQTSSSIPGGTSVTVTANRYGSLGGVTYGARPGHYVINVKARLGSEQSCDVPLEVLAAGSHAPAGGAPIAQLTANGQTGDVSVQAGSQVRLVWTSSGASGCQLNVDVPGGVGPAGATIVTAGATRQYQLTCFAPGATASSGQVNPNLAVDSFVTVRVHTGSGSMSCGPSDQTILTVPQDFQHPTTERISVTCHTVGVTGTVSFDPPPPKPISCIYVTPVGSLSGLPAGDITLNFDVQTGRGAHCTNPFDLKLTAKTSDGNIIDQQTLYLWQVSDASVCGIPGVVCNPADGYIFFGGSDASTTLREVHVPAGTTVPVEIHSQKFIHYNIISQPGLYYGVPNPNIATATIDGTTLKITGVAAGQTTVSVSSDVLPGTLPGGAPAYGRSFAALNIIVGGTATPPPPPPPGTQPSITITSPHDGDEVTGDTFDMSATFSNIAEGKIRMLVDGVSVGTCPLTETPCVRPVQIKGWADGVEHTLTAKLKDNDSVSTSIKVKKKAGTTPPPPAAPTITFDDGTLPGPTVSSSFTVSATATNLASNAFIKIQADDGENSHNCPTGQATCSLQVEIANWVPGTQYHIWASVKDSTGQLATTANPLTVQKAAAGGTPPGGTATVTLTLTVADTGHMTARAVLSNYAQLTAKFKLFAEDGVEVGSCAEGSFTCEVTFGIKQWTSGPHTITVNVKDAGGSIASTTADFTKP